MATSKRKESDYLDLSDKPKGKDGLPIGTPCTKGCLKPPPNSIWCHCSVCHLSFRGPSYHFMHRNAGRCLDPVVLGLTEVDRLWSTPEGHEQRAMLAERMKKAREHRKERKS